jgi:hypothetical protein
MKIMSTEDKNSKDKSVELSKIPIFLLQNNDHYCIFLNTTIINRKNLSLLAPIVESRIVNNNLKILHWNESYKTLFHKMKNSGKCFNWKKYITKLRV